MLQSSKNETTDLHILNVFNQQPQIEKELAV